MTAKTYTPTFDSLDELQTLLMTIEETAGQALLNPDSIGKDPALWMIEKLCHMAAHDIGHMQRKEDSRG